MYLAQRHKLVGRNVAQTHSIDDLVIMSPALFRYFMYYICGIHIYYLTSLFYLFLL